MQNHEDPMNAMESLDGSQGSMAAAAAGAAAAGGPMLGKWGDQDQQSKKKRGGGLEGSNADNRMLFFAKVLRSASEDDVKSLFSQYGKVYDVNLFRAFQGAPTTKGCGLVTMGTHDEADAAIEALDNTYVWDGMESPMVVKWMDTALQRRRREQHLAAMRQGLVPSMAMAAGPDPWVPAGFALAGMPPHMHMGMPPSAMMSPAVEAQDNPPSGCALDSIKLFVGNIPRSYTEEQLLPFFETIGKVVELVIVRDKATQESKGSAFVWYTTRSLAERAILQFNLRHVLPDPTGEQDRPLVVRKAKARVRQMHPAVGMLTGMEQRAMEYPSHLQVGHAQAPLVVHPYYAKSGPGMMGPGLDALSVPPPGAQVAMGMVGPPAGAYHEGLSGGTAQLTGVQGVPTVQEGGMYGAYGQGGPENMDGHLQGQSGPQPVDNMGQFAVSLAINQQQMMAVNTHMYSIQAMSGAHLNITPGTMGFFHMVITGSKGQVDNARSLISTVFGTGT